MLRIPFVGAKALNQRKLTLMQRFHRLNRRIQIVIIIAVAVELLVLYNDPTVGIRQVRGLQRHLSHKSQKIKYQMIKDMHGDIAMQLAMTGDSLNKDWRCFNKAWKDTLWIFGHRA